VEASIKVSSEILCALLCSGARDREHSLGPSILSNIANRWWSRLRLGWFVEKNCQMRTPVGISRAYENTRSNHTKMDKRRIKIFFLVSNRYPEPHHPPEPLTVCGPLLGPPRRAPSTCRESARLAPGEHHIHLGTWQESSGTMQSRPPDYWQESRLQDCWMLSSHTQWVGAATEYRRAIAGGSNQ
jgi:hypothetical protein